jgi:chromosome segregation ATPase
MGRPAHDVNRSVADTAGAMSDHDTLLAEIRAQLAGSRRDLSKLERTLTDGYAEALSLEATRLRLLRRLGSLAATLEGDDVADKTKELSSLAKEIEEHNAVLTELRELLEALRKEYSRGASAARAHGAPVP